MLRPAKSVKTLYHNEFYAHKPQIVDIRKQVCHGAAKFKREP